jgi:hypothetical protein
MVFVSLDFVPPSELRAHDFVLRPLGPQYNDSDYLAWTSSIQHIRSTPDFEIVLGPMTTSRWRRIFRTLSGMQMISQSGWDSPIQSWTLRSPR